MCVIACTRFRDRRGNPLCPDHWCSECRVQYALDIEDEADIAVLAVIHAGLDDYLPASDEESRRRLDDLAPIDDVILMPISVPCALCKGERTIALRDDCMVIECPWCGGTGMVPDEPDWEQPEFSGRAG